MSLSEMVTEVCVVKMMGTSLFQPDNYILCLCVLCVVFNTLVPIIRAYNFHVNAHSGYTGVSTQNNASCQRDSTKSFYSSHGEFYAS